METDPMETDTMATDLMEILLYKGGLQNERHEKRRLVAY